MIKGRIIIADIEKISCNKEWILSQIAQRYVEKYQKHKRETDKKQELIAGYGIPPRYLCLLVLGNFVVCQGWYWRQRILSSAGKAPRSFSATAAVTGNSVA